MLPIEYMLRRRQSHHSAGRLTCGGRGQRGCLFEFDRDEELGDSSGPHNSSKYCHHLAADRSSAVRVMKSVMECIAHGVYVPERGGRLKSYVKWSSWPKELLGRKSFIKKKRQLR